MTQTHTCMTMMKLMNKKEETCYRETSSPGADINPSCCSDLSHT